MHSLMNLFTRPRAVIQSAVVLCLLVSLAACGGDAKVTAKEHYERAVQLEREGKLQASGIELKNALQNDPELISARLLLGKIAFRLGDVLSAEKEFSKARDLGAEQKDWGPPLALVWLKHSEFEKVLEELPVEVTMPAEQRATFYALRGHAYRGMEQIDDARASFENALKLKSYEVSALVGIARLDMAASEFDVAQVSLEKALNLEPDNTDALTTMGDLMLVKKDFAAAEDLFSRVQQATPENLALRLPLARAQMYNRNYTGAMASVRPLLKSGPKHPGANNILALAAYETKDYEAAYSYSQTVLGVAPNHAPSMLIAGASSYALDQHEQAYRHLASYLNLVPDDENARKLMGASLLKMGRAQEAATTLSPLSESEDGETLALISNTAIYNRDLDGGIRYMERAVESAPDDARMRMGLGLLRIAKGRTDEGVAELEEAFALDPSEENSSNVDAAVKTATRQSLSRGQFDQALTLAKRVLERDPDDPAAHFLLGASYAGLGRSEEALNSYQKALELEPGRVDATMTLAIDDMKAGKYDEAEALLNASLQLHPQRAILLVSLAQISIYRDDVDQAEKYLNLAISAEPTELQPRILLSRLLLERGVANTALSVLDEVSETYTNNVRFLAALGEAQLANRLGGKASVTYETLLRLRPNDGHFHYQKAQASALLESRDEMRRDLERAVELEPAHPFARYSLVQLLLADGEPGKARPHADYLALNNPEDPRFVALQSEVALLEGEPDSAIRTATLGLERDPTNAALLHTMATAQLRLQRLNAAAQTYERLIALQPNEAEPRFLLGRVMTRLGDIDRAKTLMQEALATSPNMLEAKLALAHIALSENDKPTAYRLARELAKARPDNPEVLEISGDLAILENDLVEARTNYIKANRRLSTAQLVEKLANVQWATERREEAMVTLEEWVDGHPGDHLRQLKLAEFYFEERGTAAAKVVLDRVANEAASDWIVVNELAWQYYLIGAAEEALPFAQHANVLTPNNPAVQDTLGVVLLQLGEKQQAEAMLREASRAAPQDPQITYHLAQALVENGKEDEARTILTKMLASSANFADRPQAELLLTELPE